VSGYPCRVAGLGWVTPLGCDLEEVADAIARRAVVEPRCVSNPETGREHFYLPVPAEAVAHLGRHARLRRSSAISYFAVAAAEAALADARLTLTTELAARTAVVLAVSNGGVVYTRRFYEQIVKGGAASASPLLFPETVYNAPASHLAAFLGLDGATYTLVGDNSVGLSALHFGAQLIALGDADHCLVVGCEELDWILCEAYRDWRLSRTPLAEGAGAVLLAREGPLTVTTHAGVPFFRQREAAAALSRVLGETLAAGSADCVFTSANDTFADRQERTVLTERLPRSPLIAPKRTLGEAPGASALWQVITASLAVRRGEATNALVSVVGFNQQASAAVVSAEPDYSKS